MKRKIIAYAIVFAVATALAVIANLCETERKNQFNEASVVLETLPSFQQDDVVTIVIQDKKNPLVTLSKASGRWLVQCNNKPAVYANVPDIIKMMKSLSSARLLRELKITQPEGREELWLAGTQAKVWQHGGIDVKLLDKDNKTVMSLTLGAMHFSTDNTPDGRFIEFCDKQGVPHIYLTSEKFDRVIPTVGNWMMRISLLFEQCRISNMEFNYLIPQKKTIWRVQPQNGVYTITTPPQQRFSADILNKQLKLLNEGFTRDIADTGTTFQPTCEMNMALSNGISYKLIMQESEEDDMQKLCKLQVNFDRTAFEKNDNESDADAANRLKQVESVAMILKGYWGDKTFILQPNVTYQLEQIPGKTHTNGKK